VLRQFASAGWLSTDGYYRLRAAGSLPFLDFVEDAAAKKGFASHSYDTLPSGKPGAFQFFEAPLSSWRNTIREIQLQYKVRVGQGYALKHLTLYILLAAKACTGSDPAFVEAAAEAHVACGRLVYEGLGLAGYTAEAKVFFDALPRLAYDGFVLVERAGMPLEERYCVVTQEELKELELGQDDTCYQGTSALQRLFEDCTGYQLSEQAAEIVRIARRIHVCARDMAKGKESPKFKDEPFMGLTLGFFAPIAQMMRHASKGELGHGAQVDAAVAAYTEGFGFEEGPVALVDLVDERAVRYFFGSDPLVTGLVFRALNTQRGMLNARRQQAERNSVFFA
jgi:hypothetical protein